MTEKEREEMIAVYARLSTLTPERIEQVYKDWQREHKPDCAAAFAAADLTETMFIIALYEAKNRGSK